MKECNYSLPEPTSRNNDFGRVTEFGGYCCYLRHGTCRASLQFCSVNTFLHLIYLNMSLTTFPLWLSSTQKSADVGRADINRYESVSIREYAHPEIFSIAAVVVKNLVTVTEKTKRE